MKTIKTYQHELKESSCQSCLSTHACLYSCNSLTIDKARRTSRFLQVTTTSQGWINCSASEYIWVIISSVVFNNSRWVDNNKDIAEWRGAPTLTFISCSLCVLLLLGLRKRVVNVIANLPWLYTGCSLPEYTALQKTQFIMSSCCLSSQSLYCMLHKDTLVKNANANTLLYFRINLS